jgi:hypothetical protein
MASIQEIRSNAAKKAHETRKKKLAEQDNPKPVRKLTKRPKLVLPADPKWAPIHEVMAKTCVFILGFSTVGNRRKVDNEEFGVETESKKTFNTTKKLMNAEELTAIGSLYGELKRRVLLMALPSNIKAGVYILPTDSVKATEKILTEGQAKLNVILDQLCTTKRMKEIVEEAEGRLSKVNVGGKKKNFFDAEEYLSPAELRSAFEITWRLVYVDSAENLQAVSREIYEKEKAKAKVEWEERSELIQQILRAQMKSLVDHLVDRMTPDEYGRCKTFHSFEKFDNFLTTLDTRNIFGDLQIKTLATECRSLLKETGDLELLRSDVALRDHVKDGFEQVSKILDDLIQDAPKRRITLRD